MGSRANRVSWSTSPFFEETMLQQPKASLLLVLLTSFLGRTIALKCFQCGGLSGLPCDDFDTDKIEFSKICNTTVQSCITSYTNGKVSLRDCWTRSLETTKCDGVKNVLMLCMCATDFCNCHSSPDLNGDSCPHPPSGATSVNFSGWGFFPLLVLIFQVAM